MTRLCLISRMCIRPTASDTTRPPGNGLASTPRKRVRPDSAIGFALSFVVHGRQRDGLQTLELELGEVGLSNYRGAHLLRQRRERGVVDGPLHKQDPVHKVQP